MTKYDKTKRIHKLEQRIRDYQRVMETELGFGTPAYEKGVLILAEMMWELDSLLGVTHDVYVSPKCEH